MENSILNIFGSVDVKITPDICFKNNFVVPILNFPLASIV